MNMYEWFMSFKLDSVPLVFHFKFSFNFLFWSDERKEKNAMRSAFQIYTITKA